MYPITFVDAEIDIHTKKILDLGAVTLNDDKLHTTFPKEFVSFIKDDEYICGHNILSHDLKYISSLMNNVNYKYIDTLYLSPLMFPDIPSHALLKDDKLQTDELNNPLNDALKAKELFLSEIDVFKRMNDNIKSIYFLLLNTHKEFSNFFRFMNYSTDKSDLEMLIREEFNGRICSNAELDDMIKNYAIELAYCLSLISTSNRYSIIPRWVYKNFPAIENVLRILRNTPCDDINCVYCQKQLDIHLHLKNIFGYDEFRTYDNEPLQEKAVKSAVENKSLLAIFPTGGGKSLTFQLPALIAGGTSRGLTVVISPLQSLMKDQVDNLEAKGIVDAVTINGLLSPIERADAIQRVENGLATMLYIAPESLRSKTIERLLLGRNVVRFVIDEAHCFSAWGQDFRVDYLYIGDFIKHIQDLKNINYQIPVSCFTATAKRQVISDIMAYFKQKLDINLELFSNNATRTNLKYEVMLKENEDEKYNALRGLIEEKNCPTIVYVSRTKRTIDLASKLQSDGFEVRPFHGKMESKDKIANQEAFIKGEVQIIVATSAFGMGVDKKDVKLVIHYDISDSLENYVQEAGRAGRDESINAECYILFNDEDLNKHFMLLNQTKVSMNEIQQVWKAIKDLTRMRKTIYQSPLEIARQAGWDDNIAEIETRVKTAVSALETAGYVKRGKNVPRIYATSILAKNMMEARQKIESSKKFNDEQKQTAIRIIHKLISSRSRADAGNDDAESRIDYISDSLGITKECVLESINLMREEGLLADAKDLTVYIKRNDNQNKSKAILQNYISLEKFLLSQINGEDDYINLKETNDNASKNGVKSSSVNAIKTILYYWTIKSYIKKAIASTKNRVFVIPQISIHEMAEKVEKRLHLANFIVDYLFRKSMSLNSGNKEEILIEFSILEIEKTYNGFFAWFDKSRQITAEHVEDALLYLSKIGSLKLEGGFLVIYNTMEIKRIELDNKIRYKNDDYKDLKEYYKNKIQQIHIVGEYAKIMVESKDKASQFVNDYFQIEYKQFLNKYFIGERLTEIENNITPEKYRQIFGLLSEKQLSIISDKTSNHIVVTAGPGSGKTRVLVHKLASLMLLEDVKHEQLLMLTFSRAAVTEFKKRLLDIIGNAANLIEIKTFHSYCFDLLGKIGNLESLEETVKNATNMIRNGDVDLGRITKMVVVIDEAQDMDKNEFDLIEALIEKNENMKVIAVGDDDQNIYEFRGSSSKYLKAFITDKNAVQYDMVENYRSKRNIVDFANVFVKGIKNRMKQVPIKSMLNEDGVVCLTKHTGSNLEIPLVNEIINTYKTGSICVLTNTNDEALRVTGLLIEKGISAKLIQSNDGFNLYNLLEIRYFLNKINAVEDSPIINNDVWENAKNTLKEVYEKSECLQICLNLIEEFENANPTRKYKTDLREFIQESHIEDFYKEEKGLIMVSTIHKAKGREFDNVYMLTNNVNLNSDEEKRKIYVGLTRTKNELYIHYNNNCLDNIDCPFVQKKYDNAIYPMPNKVILQLGLGDVYLDAFKDKKNFICKYIKSGDELVIDKYDNNRLGIRDKKNVGYIRLFKFSKECIDKINQLKNQNYYLEKATVRFIVAWKSKDAKEDDEELAIILPNLYFNNGKP